LWLDIVSYILLFGVGEAVDNIVDWRSMASSKSCEDRGAL
jgi:hypothetical protein